ncbi:MAG: hypothetical protein R3E66_05750 [bacterium]
MDAGDVAGARRDLNAAVERAPANVGIWIAASRVLLRSKDPQDHKRGLEDALKAAALALARRASQLARQRLRNAGSS